MVTNGELKKRIYDMAIIKIDVPKPSEKKKKEAMVPYGSRIPKSLKAELDKLPSDYRAQLAIEFWTSVVKQNAS